MNDNVIKTEGLQKIFGRGKEAVKGIDLDVSRGSVYVFFGRNGAGKTTTIRMLLGLLEKTAGKIEVLGQDPLKNPVAMKEKIGYVAENQKMYNWMNIGELLWFNASFYPKWDNKLADKLLSRFSLKKDLKLESLSRGMYAQVALILALSQQPELLILDDPTSGLDPIVRREFMESIIGVLNEEERTVFFSTHIVNEIENIADHAGIMHEGRLLLSDTMENLKRSFKKIRLIFEDKIPDNFTFPEILKKETIGHELILHVKNHSEELMKKISGLNPKTTEITNLSIEDIFVLVASGR